MQYSKKVLRKSNTQLDANFQSPTFTGSFFSRQDNEIHLHETQETPPTPTVMQSQNQVKKITRDTFPRFACQGIPQIPEKQKPLKVIKVMSKEIFVKRKEMCYSTNTTQRSPNQTIKGQLLPQMMKNRTHSQQEIQVSLHAQFQKSPTETSNKQNADLLVSFFDKNAISDHSTNITESLSSNSSKLIKDSGLYQKGLRLSNCKQEIPDIRKKKPLIINKNLSVQPTVAHHYRDKIALPIDSIIESLPESKSQSSSVNKNNLKFVFAKSEFVDNEFLYEQDIRSPQQEMSFSEVAAAPHAIITDIVTQCSNQIGNTQNQFRSKKPNKFLSKVQSNIIKKLFDQ